MASEDGLSPTPIEKSDGCTDAERYLRHLCDRSFLSMWSYPRPHRDQGGQKEICDLLMVMGDDVIVFSDKHSLLRPNKTLDVDWARWFRSAVKAGVQQAWGAERWFRTYPDRVFLDSACTRRLPVPLPAPETARYHLVVTVHGVAGACRAVHGGSGSLMLRSDLRGFTDHTQPFVLGDFDPGKTFVHVLDDTSLDIVMSALDTAPDFLRYLREKENFLRSRRVFATGEEDLLAFYLSRVDESGEHAFVIDPSIDAIMIDETSWASFVKSREYRSKAEHDRVSYAWDDLIERFGKHALAGTQQFATLPQFESSERILRVMAAEPRLRRRYLAQHLLDAVAQTPSHLRRIRVACGDEGEPFYVFLLFPWREELSEERNRNIRREYLEVCVRVVKHQNPNAKHLIGIATESGVDHHRRSEDAIFFDATEWTEDDDRDAQQLQAKLDILTKPRMSSTRIEEYPVGRPQSRRPMEVPKNPRNKRCPCGSGEKFKHCHGRPPAATHRR